MDKFEVSYNGIFGPGPHAFSARSTPPTPEPHIVSEADRLRGNALAVEIAKLESSVSKIGKQREELAKHHSELGSIKGDLANSLQAKRDEYRKVMTGKPYG